MKYLVCAQQRQELEKVFADYLIPDSHGESTIRNIYYDTDSYTLIRHSLEKPVYKEKLRLRCYNDADLQTPVFVELKKKFDSTVFKRRVTMPLGDAENFLLGAAPPQSDQIINEIAYFRDFYENLKPKVYLCYDRTAFYSKDDPSLRLTFDRNILYRTDKLRLIHPPGGKQLLDDDTSLLEIKASNALPLWLCGLLAQNDIKKISFSKYGLAYIDMQKREE